MSLILKNPFALSQPESNTHTLRTVQDFDRLENKIYQISHEKQGRHSALAQETRGGKFRPPLAAQIDQFLLVGVVYDFTASSCRQGLKDRF